MTLKDHLLVILIEECAEVQKEAAKCLRFGLESTNPQTKELNVVGLRTEIAHIWAAVLMLQDHATFMDLTSCPSDHYLTSTAENMVLDKMVKVRRHLDLSRQTGRLNL